MSAVPHHLEVQTSDGAVLHASCEGHGPVLMLISGLGGTAGFWNPVVQRLAAQFTIVRFDQRGIAASSRGAAPCTTMTLAQDSFLVLDAFGIQRASVLGHSTGGCIVQCMATISADRLKQAILSATWIKAGAYMRALFSMRKSLLSTAPQAYAESAALLSYPAVWLQGHWSVFEKAVAGTPTTDLEKAVIAERIDALLAHDGQTMLRALTMPTLLLGSEDDVIVPSFHQRELAAALPESQIHLFAHGGHFFPVTQTERFVEHLAAFVGGAA